MLWQSQVKSTLVTQGIVALSAIGWYQKGSLCKLWLHNKILKTKNYVKTMYNDFFKKWFYLIKNHNLFKIKTNKRVIEVTWVLY